MLPPELTMMASLLPGTDKLAVSIILEMSPDANVISHTFSQSIIHSCAQLHYSHAQVYFNLYIYTISLLTIHLIFLIYIWVDILGKSRK